VINVLYLACGIRSGNVLLLTGQQSTIALLCLFQQR
jgi:hypothetical protein